MPLQVQLKIFSRAGLSLTDSSQNGIHNVSRIVDRNPEPCDGEWLEGLPISAELLNIAEVDRVFFGSQESVGLRVAARANKVLNIVQAISMVIAKNNFRRRRNPGAAYLLKKLFRTRDTTENNRPGGWWIRQKDLALNSPQQLLLWHRGLHCQATGQYNRICPCQRR